MIFKQKTAYEILRSDWSSDVCSSDLSCIVSTLSTGFFKQMYLPDFHSTV